MIIFLMCKFEDKRLQHQLWQLYLYFVFLLFNIWNSHSRISFLCFIITKWFLKMPALTRDTITCTDTPGHYIFLEGFFIISIRICLLNHPFLDNLITMTFYNSFLKYSIDFVIMTIKNKLEQLIILISTLLIIDISNYSILKMAAWAPFTIFKLLHHCSSVPTT